MSWRAFFGQRLVVVVPAAAAITAFAILDGARWRALVMVPTLVVLVALFLHEARRRAPAERLSGNLVVPMLAQMAAILATGGLDSPMLGLTIVLSCFAGAQAYGLWYVACQGALLLGMALCQIEGLPPALLPALLGGPAHAHTPALVLATAVGQGLVMFMAYWIGRTLRGGYDGALAKSVRARDELVRIEATHAVELQAVCGEISHELKNPLGTIRGLVELMDLDAPSPRNAERLAVLLREAVRMQGSIDALLNLSRPLSPLDLAPVDLGALRDEVCSLHEGVCAKAGVALAAPAAAGGDLVVRGDFRKLRQVLVNLVQNAIEASAPGATVTVTIRAEGERAAVEVADEGPGLDPAVAERAFEPGVTGKERGNGLGLTIARTIARQHGGDVTLHSRAPRGCVAAILLPVAGPA